MANDVSRARYRAILVPDPRVDFGAWSTSLSTVTQQGPRPGVPEAQQDTDMVLDGSGEQEASSSIRVRCLGAGMPGPEAGRGTFAWKNEADASTRWRGWEGALAVAGWEAIEYTTTGSKWRNPHAVTLADGTVLVAVTKLSRYVRVWARTTAGVWTEYGVFDHGANYAADAHPTLVELPSGRVLVFFLVEATGESQVRMWYSDDQGATWTQGQKSCLVSAIDTTVYTPRRMRAAYANGQVLLVGWVTDATLALDDILVQWASSDLGARFNVVDTWAGADEESQGAYVDIAVRNQQFVVAYVRRESAVATDGVPYVRVVGSAYTPLSAAEQVLAQHPSNPMRWGTMTGGAFTSGRLALWADEDGVLFLAGLDHDAGGGALREGYIARSQDGGLNWSTPGGGSAPGWGGTWWNGQDAATHPDQLAGCSQGGRQILVHNFAANPGTGDDSICVAYIGGYSTVCLPARSEMSKPHDHAGFERTWLPYDFPENTGGQYTLGTTGAPVVTLDTATGTMQVVQGGGADSATWTTAGTPPGSLAEGIYDQLEVEVDAANSGDAFLQVRIGAAGPASYEVRVTVTPTTIVLRDMAGSTDIATVNTTAGTLGVIVRVDLVRDGAGGPANDGRVKAWYTTELTGGDREWIVIGESSTLSMGGATTHRIQWGVLAGASTCRFKQQHYTSDDYTGQHLLDQTNPHQLPGRNFASSPLWVDSGLKLRAKDGPAYRNDEWLVSTRYDWPVENLHYAVSPSPSRGWRSVDDNSDVYIACEVTATAAQAAPFLGECVGCYLGGINFRTWELHGRNASGTWVTILSGDAAEGQTNLTFIRQGDMVFPDASAVDAAEDYFPFNILEGSYFKLQTQQGEGLTDVVRRIRANSEGAWQGTGTTKRVSILLEDTVTADQATATTGQIWSKEAFACRSDATRYTAYRIKIPAQTTCEGYFHVGVAVAGHVALLARQYSLGRALGWTANTELVTARSGTRRARALSSPRRSAEMAWIEGVDISQIGGVNPVPDYVRSAVGGNPAATPADTPLLVVGLLDRLRGSRDPVVYLPSLPRAAATNVDVQIVSRQAMLYGRVVSESLSVETVLGEELADPGEVVRLAGLRIEEEL